MLKKTALVLLVLCLALWLAPAAFAQPGRSGGKWWNRPVVADKLALTDAEKTRLDELYAESERKRIDLKAAVERQRFELTQTMENGKAGEKDILARYQQLQAAQNQLAEARFRFLLDVRSTIGADRFRNLSEMFEEFRSSRMSRWKQGMTGGPGMPPGQKGEGMGY